MKKSKFFENLPGKIEVLVKLPEKIEIFRKFAWKDRNLFDPDPRPPKISNQIDATDKLSFSLIVQSVHSRPAVLNLWAADQWWSAETCLVVREEDCEVFQISSFELGLY